MQRITKLLRTLGNGLRRKVREYGVGLGNTARVASVLLFLWGLAMLFFYSLPMLQQDYHGASESMYADRAIVLYDLGLQRYEQEAFKPAVQSLNEAYNACLGKDGIVEGDKRLLAANIKFLTGNALVNSQQMQAAVEAYKEALRLNPNHMEAKYNLELLQAMNGGKGPGPDPQPGGQPGKGIKKGI